MPPSRPSSDMSEPLPVPKYHQVYLVLREQIAEGRFAAGVPPELQLVQQFGVSRITVRRALEQLRRDGLITRAPGRGTHPIARARPAADGRARGRAAAAPERAHLSGLLENLVSMGLKTSVKVLEVATVAATHDVAQALGLADGAPVQKAVRVRSTREGPLSHITTWVPADLARGFGRRELAKEPILVLLERAGVRVGTATQKIGAKLADSVVAPHLGVAVGSALLAVRRLIFDVDGRPVQWLHGLYRPDRYEYEMQLSRVGTVDARIWVSRDTTAPFK